MMDHDASANQIDPVERVTPATGESDTGSNDDEAARVTKERRKHGTAQEDAHSPVQTKQTPNP